MAFSITLLTVCTRFRIIHSTVGTLLVAPLLGVWRRFHVPHGRREHCTAMVRSVVASSESRFTCNG